VRKVSLDQVQPGMVLGKSILGGSGQVLLNNGIKMKPQYLYYLKKLGIEVIYIEDSRMKDVEFRDLIKEETRQEARSQVKEIFLGLKNSDSSFKGFAVKEKKVIETVSKVIEEVLENKEITAQLMDIRSMDDYLFAHSVNCCVLATLTGANMNFDQKILKNLALGALLHDIGLASVPCSILKKPGPLTRDEYKIVKNHPLYGHDSFKKISVYSPGAATLILQHHERWQGQGYPQGLEGKNINFLAHIIAIADAYDAMTSERPYRKAYQPHQAVEMLMSQGDKSFNLDVLRQFLYNISAYPLGSLVFLSNEESGLVIANNPGLTLRPVVRIIYKGKDMCPHPSPYDLDLSEVLNLVIERVISN